MTSFLFELGLKVIEDWDDLIVMEELILEWFWSYEKS